MKKLDLSLSVLACALLSAEAFGASISVGNLVIYRVGNGSATLGTTATAVFLDEYTTSGALVQSIALPTTGASSLTAVGNASTEGVISRSQNGSSLVFTGYRKDVGGTSPAGDASTVTSRVIGTVGLNGLTTTGVGVTDTGTTAARSATSVNGSSFYLSTAAGVRYVGTPSGASTSVLIDSRNSRQVTLSANTLIASNGSTAITSKVQSYGTLPTTTTAATSIVDLALTDAVNGITLVDLSAGVAGDDTLYILSTVENLLRKYTFNGTSWSASGSIGGGGAANLTALAGGGGVRLFLTTATTLLPFTDTTGYNGALTGSLGAAIATAPINTGFRGIGVFVPEPTSALLGGLAGTLLLARRRRRSA